MIEALVQAVFAIDEAVRYVAVRRGPHLLQRQRAGLCDASATESDRYEELLVNPTLLTLATARGDIDCGGTRYLLVRYGNFFQLILPRSEGHLSVCIEASADALRIADAVQAASAAF